jgi:hypothetical protein
MLTSPRCELRVVECERPCSQGPLVNIKDCTRTQHMRTLCGAESSSELRAPFHTSVPSTTRCHNDGVAPAFGCERPWWHSSPGSRLTASTRCAHHDCISSPMYLTHAVYDREITAATARYVDQCAVTAAIEGRVLILDGMEKVPHPSRSAQCGVGEHER